jgi:hypothetical protein
VADRTDTVPAVDPEGDTVQIIGRQEPAMETAVCEQLEKTTREEMGPAVDVSRDLSSPEIFAAKERSNPDDSRGYSSPIQATTTGSGHDSSSSIQTPSDTVAIGPMPVVADPLGQGANLEEAFFAVSVSGGVVPTQSWAVRTHSLPPVLGLHQDTVDDAMSSVALSPLASYTGPDSQMRMVRRSQPRPEAPAGVPEEEVTSEPESVALGRMKQFCARILKALAPPLLREVESASTLRPDAAPFTPRRSVRFSTPVVQAGKQPRKATAAENVLLKALGITPADLSVDDKAL